MIFNFKMLKCKFNYPPEVKESDQRRRIDYVHLLAHPPLLLAFVTAKLLPVTNSLVISYSPNLNFGAARRICFKTDFPNGA